jgi:hypothetical protein
LAVFGVLEIWMSVLSSRNERRVFSSGHLLSRPDRASGVLINLPHVPMLGAAVIGSFLAFGIAQILQMGP